MDKLSWQTKLMGLIALVLGALLLFQVFYVIPYVRNREVDNAEARQEEVARNIARELDLDLMESEDRLTRIAQLAAFRNMDLASQNRIMNTIIQTSSRFSSLLVLDAEGWFVAGTAEDLSIYQTKSYAFRPYFSVPFEQGETYFASPRFISQVGVITSVSVPLESEAGERVGVLRGGMILNGLMENVAHYPLEEGTAAYLVDREGTVVAHSGMDLFALEEGPLSLDYSGRPLVQAIMAGEKGRSRKYDHEGTPYFGSYVILESNGWGVVVEASMSSILAASEALGGRLLLVNVALFVIALAVSLAFTRQIMAERRRREKALRMREQAIATSITPFVVADLEGKLTYVNPAFVKLWGYDEEAEVLGKPATDFWLREEEAAEVIAALQKEGFWRGEMMAKRKDGSAFTADVSASVVVDATGVPICLASSFIDTTERVRAEAELRESRERFALFMHHLPAAVYLKDTEGRILFLNEYFEKLFHRRADECIGKTDFDLFPADVAEQLREADQQVLAEGKSVESVEKIPQEDGLHTYLAYKFPLLREGTPTLLGGISLDITARVRAEEELEASRRAALNMMADAEEARRLAEQANEDLRREVAERKRAEEELRKYQDQLEELVEERTRELREAQERLIRQEKLAVLGKLAGGVGHELRNPLGAIKNAAYFLNMVIEEPEPEVKETLEILEQEVGTSERIISSLLDFARAKPPIRRKVDVNEVVRAALSRTDVPQSVEVVSQLDETLPLVLADPDQLAQVFDNLIRNGIQAMPEGGQLVVETWQVFPKLARSGQVAVSITDTGVGIPEEDLEKIFEPLFTTKAKGIGLGLAVVRTLVEGNGGSVEVESTVGKGSTFTVRLPMSRREKK